MSNVDTVVAAVQAKLGPASVSAAPAPSRSPVHEKPYLIPPPPTIPSYLSPNPNNFAGYKLNDPLPFTEIPLAASMQHAQLAATSNVASFLTMSQRLRTNQLVCLHATSGSSEATKPGAHALYYIDHTGLWQVDPPSLDVSRGGSHCIYPFSDSKENGIGLSLHALAPCFLLLTRSGGRLTVFHARPIERAVSVMFDGSPLASPPREQHDATIMHALVSANRDELGVILYEFWEEREIKDTTHQIGGSVTFVPAGEQVIGPGIDTPHTATSAAPLKSGSTKQPHTDIKRTPHALHKVTLLKFHIRNLPGFSSPLDTTPHNLIPDAANSPQLDLIHTFTSLTNHKLMDEDGESAATRRLDHDANWSAPQAAWLEIPPEQTHRPFPSGGAGTATSTSSSSSSSSSSTFSASPPSSSFRLFIVSRVPYLNETESVLYELQRVTNEREQQQREKMLMETTDRIPRVSDNAMDTTETSSSSASAAASSSSDASTIPKFTSDRIVPDTHNLKNYNIDQEDDDEDMDELGTQNSGTYSINPQVDASIQLFDALGNTLARRSLKQQTFLFAQFHSAEYMKSSFTVIGIKQNDELLLYTIHSAPQHSSEGLSLGAAGAVGGDVDRVGIVFKPIFSYTGLGYVQSGKQHKKFFLEDGSHQHILIGEFTRHIYVYGRPSTSSPNAPHYLIQLPIEESDGGEDARQIYGLQTVIVPIVEGSAASVQGQPLLYVLTQRNVRQYRLPIVTLPA